AVAKTALRERVAQRALERISDAHTLGSIARHAPLETVRLAALAALTDRDEILNVALNGAFKDTAVAAVEYASSRAELEQIVTRARNKHASKRARVLLREADDRAAAEAAALAEAEEALAATVEVP